MPKQNLAERLRGIAAASPRNNRAVKRTMSLADRKQRGRTAMKRFIAVIERLFHETLGELLEKMANNGRTVTMFSYEGFSVAHHARRIIMCSRTPGQQKSVAFATMNEIAAVEYFDGANNQEYVAAIAFVREKYGLHFFKTRHDDQMWFKFYCTANRPGSGRTRNRDEHAK